MSFSFFLNFSPKCFFWCAIYEHNCPYLKIKVLSCQIIRQQRSHLIFFGDAFTYLLFFLGEVGDWDEENIPLPPSAPQIPKSSLKKTTDIG